MKRIRALALRLSLAFLPFAAPLSARAACTGNGTGFTNPLNACGITDFVVLALKAFVLLAVPVIAFFIVLSGFMFVFARGNETRLAKAKQNFLYVIIGTVLILGAWLLATLIGATIDQIVGG